jgi:hypothetical protein
MSPPSATPAGELSPDEAGGDDGKGFDGAADATGCWAPMSSPETTGTDGDAEAEDGRDGRDGTDDAVAVAGAGRLGVLTTGDARARLGTALAAAWDVTGFDGTGFLVAVAPGGRELLGDAFGAVPPAAA